VGRYATLAVEQQVPKSGELRVQIGQQTVNRRAASAYARPVSGESPEGRRNANLDCHSHLRIDKRWKRRLVATNRL
jgi:hypothetical protein